MMILNPPTSKRGVPSPPYEWSSLQDKASIEIVSLNDGSRGSQSIDGLTESAAFRALLEQIPAAGGATQGKLYRVANIDVENRSVDLANAATFAVLIKNLSGVQLPPIVYVGQLVLYDKDNGKITSGSTPHLAHAGAVKWKKPWEHGIVRILVVVARELTSDLSDLHEIRKRLDAHHIVVLSVEDNVLQSSTKFITIVNDRALRLTLASTGEPLPIVFSAKPPSNAFKVNGEFALDANAGPKEVGQAILADMLDQRSSLPGAYLTTSNVSVPPEHLVTYSLSDSDLWVVTPSPVTQTHGAVYTVKGNYYWLNVSSWACLDLGPKGPLFRQDTVIRFS